MRHTPVLLQEVIDGLNLDAKIEVTGITTTKRTPTIIDCNLGDGGHSQAIIERLNGKVRIAAFDLDGDAIDRATTNIFSTDTALKGKFTKDQFLIFRRNFRSLKETCREAQIEGVDGILFDLGLSSYELDESGRGFSFRRDEPLSMMFGTGVDHVFTASDVVNNWSEEHIEAVIRGYGEERFSARIARAIVAARGGRTENGEPERPIKTTFQLAEIVKGAMPMFKRFGRIHPATKTFQALRIAVNDEISALEDALPQAFDLLRSGGRLVVISYHSLEDRPVKKYFKTLTMETEGESTEGSNEEDGMVRALAITKKPITPSEKELIENPRSRSAKLRIIEKI